MKFVQEHCSICNKELDMQVVQEDEKHPSLIWVRCPECNEIKPVDADPGSTGAGNPSENMVVSPRRRTEKESGEKEPHRVIRHYRAGERFLPGEWIYHPGWNDTGQVVEKCCSTGGREIIVVTFEKMGKKRLISNFAG